MKTYKITYHFTSSQADGDSYTRSITLKAKNYGAAESVAKLEGFQHFGHLINDNCFDWEIKEVQ